MYGEFERTGQKAVRTRLKHPDISALAGSLSQDSNTHAEIRSMRPPNRNLNRNGLLAKLPWVSQLALERFPALR
jgi:hypothetical protein